MLGDPKVALSLFRQARPEFGYLAELDPTRVLWFQWQASVDKRIGLVLVELGDFPGALEAYENSRIARERLVELTASNPDEINSLAWHHIEIGGLHEQNGDTVSARQQWQRAIELIEPVNSVSPWDNSLDTQAQALLRLGRVAEARPFVDQLRQLNWQDPSFLSLVEQSGL